jgi:hypothetical protein
MTHLYSHLRTLLLLETFCFQYNRAIIIKLGYIVLYGMYTQASIPHLLSKLVFKSLLSIIVQQHICQAFQIRLFIILIQARKLIVYCHRILHHKVAVELLITLF